MIHLIFFHRGRNKLSDELLPISSHLMLFFICLKFLLYIVYLNTSDVIFYRYCPPQKISHSELQYISCYPPLLSSPSNLLKLSQSHIYKKTFLQKSHKNFYRKAFFNKINCRQRDLNPHVVAHNRF